MDSLTPGPSPVHGRGVSRTLEPTHSPSLIPMGEGVRGMRESPLLLHLLNETLEIKFTGSFRAGLPPDLVAALAPYKRVRCLLLRRADK